MKTNTNAKIAEKIKGFLGLAGNYAEAAAYLTEHGYDEEYIRMLREAADNAKTAAGREEGKALIAQGLMFRGQLTAALTEYEGVKVKSLKKELAHVFINNYILCLFLMGRKERINELYTEYNDIALAEDSIPMRRTIGIREHCAKRYENSVTVFVKALSAADPRSTLMIDICLVKSEIALDMYDRADELAKKHFSAYYGKGELTAVIKKLEMRIASGLTNSSKTASKGSSKGGKKRKKK